MNLESVKEEAREIFVEFTNGMCEAMALGRKTFMSIVSDAMRVNWLWGFVTRGSATTISKNINFGSLYNWYVMADERGICPDGWHVPTDIEYVTLLENWDTTTDRGKALAMASLAVWENIDGVTNSSGFSAVGGALRSVSGGIAWYWGAKLQTHMWTSVEFDATSAYEFNIWSDFRADVNVTSKLSGLSVRLIKDNSTWTDGDTLIDKEGNSYGTVKIGDQVWMTEGLIVEKFNNGDDIPVVSDSTQWANATSSAMCYYNDNANNSYTETEQFNVIDSLDDSPTLAIEKLRHYRGIYKNIDLSQIGIVSESSTPSGQTTSDLIRSGQQDSVIGANAIVFSSPLGTDNYTVNVWIIGTSESQYDLGDITKAETGFTVSDALIEGTLYYQVIVIV